MYGPDDLRAFRAFFEGSCSVEGQVPPHIHQLPGHFHGPGEAVEHPRRPGNSRTMAMVSAWASRSWMITGSDSSGPGPAGCAAPAAAGAGDFPPVVVQADLTDGHCLVLPGQSADGVQVLRAKNRRSFPDGCPRRRRHGENDGPAPPPSGRTPRCSRDTTRPTPCSGQGGQQGLPVAVELVVVSGRGCQTA